MVSRCSETVRIMTDTQAIDCVAFDVEGSGACCVVFVSTDQRIGFSVAYIVAK